MSHKHSDLQNRSSPPLGWFDSIAAPWAGKRCTDAASLVPSGTAYGIFYGPGTWYSPKGDIGRQVLARRFPLVGPGDGFTSFVEIEDAALATVAALTAPAGTYNIVDDEPARARDGWVRLN